MRLFPPLKAMPLLPIVVFDLVGHFGQGVFDSLDEIYGVGLRLSGTMGFWVVA